MEEKHIMIQPWPYRIREKTSKREFDVLHTRSISGFGWYMEFEKSDDDTDEVSMSLSD
jgi:hypothetical protein